MNRSMRSIAAVMRQQWKVLRGDQRLGLLGLALLVASLTALVTNVVRHQNLEIERRAAAQADTAVWARQGITNPHGAAHFGHYVLKPVPALSAFDPGIFDYLGTMLRLEAHKQNVADDRPRDAGTALSAFGTFSVASALQLVAPLLIILAGFTTFSGHHARALLTQEIASGANPLTLMAGRLLTLGVILLVVLTAFAVAGAVTLLTADAAGPEYGRLAWMLAGYALYLATFLALTLGVSALCASTRAALTALLAIWLCAALLMPRIAPAVAAHVHPTPSLPAFKSEIQALIDAGLDGGQPRSARSERLRAMVLEKYRVARVEDLSVNETGA
ncbi:MAG: ABC transporter permease, partial [Burkholderiales bacterium]